MDETIHPNTLLRLIRSWKCLECRKPVDPERGWYLIRDSWRVVHDGSCWWGYCVRRGDIHVR